MKYQRKVLVLFCLTFIYFQSFAQSLNAELQNKKFKEDIDFIVEELEFMYDTDQVIREYTLFKTYNKAITDSIENLSEDKFQEFLLNSSFKSDSLEKRIYKKYILPIDELNTERIIELTQIYGFPSRSRIEKNYTKELDEEFNPYIILVHSPKKYWNKLKVIIQSELENGNLTLCEYGHILWHLNGRENIQDMLDNGFTLKTNENGQQVLKANCD